MADNPKVTADTVHWLLRAGEGAALYVSQSSPDEALRLRAGHRNMTFELRSQLAVTRAEMIGRLGPDPGNPGVAPHLEWLQARVDSACERTLALPDTRLKMPVVVCPDCGPTSTIRLVPTLFVTMDFRVFDCRQVAFVSVNGFDDDTDPKRPDAMVSVLCECGQSDNDLIVEDMSVLVDWVGAWVKQMQDGNGWTVRREDPVGRYIG